MKEFLVTIGWLRENYGSTPDQIDQTSSWLLTYGTNVRREDLDEWSKWKHLSEYQVNTPDIVPQVLGMVGKVFPSQLQAHRHINLLRVPVASNYEKALDIVRPSRILELGVGGDSAISTSIFLSYIEPLNDRYLLSCDHNPLGKTLDRYALVAFWDFEQSDSVKLLTREVEKGAKWDMVFIDTIHSYKHTMNELALAFKISDNVLLDDATFEGNAFDEEEGGVKRAIKVWLENAVCHRIDLDAPEVCLLRKGFDPKSKPEKSKKKKQSKKGNTE